MYGIVRGVGGSGNTYIPELLCLPSGLQEMGTETFLQDFSKEKQTFL